jgi:MFS family permease
MSTVSATAQHNSPARRAGWYAVSVLIVAYTFSYVDRTILTLMVKPIRASLQISDLQLSLLHGLAFAIFYTLLGIPIARLADRGNRRNIITVGIAFWSIMTALCGLARNFTQLFLARVGVGVGEAALSPAAYSMLSDYFRGNALTRALSVYTAAIYVGAGLALMIGGVVIASVPATDLPLVGHLEPWQVVFLCVGAPGVVIALLMLTVREPPRTGLLTMSGERQALSFGDVVSYMAARRGAYYFLILGFAVHSLVWNGAMAWIPTFFMRHFGWTQAQTGLQFGATLMIFGVIGIVFGGFLSGWLKASGRVDANPIVGLISALLVLPAGVLAAQSDNSTTALSLFAIFVFSGSMPYGAAATAFQDISPNQMRAQVTAIYFFALNLCGIGLGPTVVAAFTDKVFRADAAVGNSISLVIGIAAPISALLLWLSLKPYRRALTENRHSGAT